MLGSYFSRFGRTGFPDACYITARCRVINIALSCYKQRVAVLQTRSRATRGQEADAPGWLRAWRLGTRAARAYWHGLCRVVVVVGGKFSVLAQFCATGPTRGPGVSFGGLTAGRIPHHKDRLRAGGVSCVWCGGSSQTIRLTPGPCVEGSLQFTTYEATIVLCRCVCVVLVCEGLRVNTNYRRGCCLMAIAAAATCSYVCVGHPIYLRVEFGKACIHVFSHI